MASKTTNYNLTKPDPNDFYDIGIFNSNADAVDTALMAKANLDSPNFSGTPTAPTPITSDSSTQIATTAFVKANRPTIVTPTTNGLMSGPDKLKLDRIQAGANNTTIANNLTTDTAGSALDAVQGKVLKDSIDNATKFNGTTTIVSDFKGKVAGSTAENPNMIKYGAPDSLSTPINNALSEIDTNGYTVVSNLDGNCASVNNAVNTAIPQDVFAFDLISIIERKYGSIPASDTAGKVAWLKANVKSIMCRWYGYGACPGGNKARLGVYNVAYSLWNQSDTYTNTSATPALIYTDPQSYDVTSHYIDSNGFIYFLAFTDASNGTTASTIYTDYVDLEITLSTPFASDSKRISALENSNLIKAGTGASSSIINDMSNNIASGDYSLCGGYYSQSLGRSSFAIGEAASANEAYSTAIGFATQANGCNFSIGHFNKVPTAGSMGSTTGDALIIGNGNGTTGRNNACRVTYGGTSYLNGGSYNTTGADYAEFFEWEDENVNSEDRRGLFVTLDGEKIRLATPDDTYILGIVSSNPAIIGDSYADQWKEMYQTDLWGNTITEHKKYDAETKEFHHDAITEIVHHEAETSIVHHDAELDTDGKIIKDAYDETVVTKEAFDETVTVKDAYDETVVIREAYEADEPVLNPNYDPTKEYIPREKRKEWAAIGMMGKLIAIDDGTCEVNGFCTVGKGGIATKSDKGYRVMSRIDNTHIRVLFK